MITVAAELIPLTATLVGSPSLAKLSTSSVPMQYFIEATLNNTVYTIVSLGVVIAILNAVIAIVLSYGRMFLSSGRDRACLGPVNDWMTARSARFSSPWFATAVVGVLGASLCLTVPLDGAPAVGELVAACTQRPEVYALGVHEAAVADRDPAGRMGNSKMATSRQARWAR